MDGFHIFFWVPYGIHGRMIERIIPYGIHMESIRIYGTEWFHIDSLWNVGAQ
jgi:hypothetical protein